MPILHQYCMPLMCVVLSTTGVCAPQAHHQWSWIASHTSCHGSTGRVVVQHIVCCASTTMPWLCAPALLGMGAQNGGLLLGLEAHQSCVSHQARQGCRCGQHTHSSVSRKCNNRHCGRKAHARAWCGHTAQHFPPCSAQAALLSSELAHTLATTMRWASDHDLQLLVGSSS